jgi:outer membrane protein OmpA-like peptidoglycan-associated protein
MSAPTSSTQHVLCVLSEAQKQALSQDLDRFRPSGVLVFQDSPELALEQVGVLKPSLVLVGMSLDAMEGLEFLALLMRRHPDFSGKVVVVPDEGDPFPPIAQYRNASTGKSVTEETTLAQVVSWIEPLVPTQAKEPEPPPPVVEAPPRARPPIPQRPVAKPAIATGQQLPRPLVAKLAPANPVHAPPAVAIDAALATGVEAPPAVAVEAAPPLTADPPVVPRMAVERAAVAPSAPPDARSVEAVAARGRNWWPFAALAALAIAGLLAVVLARAESPRDSAAPAPEASPTTSALPGVPVGVPTSTPRPTPPAAAADFAELTTLPLRFERKSTQGVVAAPHQLDEIAKKLNHALKARPAARLEIGGHTSKEGPEYLHAKLGEQRALDAKRRLIERGIAEHRIVLRNYALTRPLPSVAGGDDLEGSRRVTVRLID